MRIAWVMFKKEMIENYKKNRLIVMAAILLLFGIMSPLTAKYLPEIIKTIMGSTEEVIKLGLLIPTPTIQDSYVQYFKNLTQMGIFVQILIFMGIISEEKSRGTVVLVLTKAVSRPTFLLAKFAAATIVLTVSLFVSSIGFYYYTYLLFDELPGNGTITGILMYFLFSIFILAYTLFASTITKSVAISALVAIGGYFSLSIISILPKISDYFPMKLTDAAYQISMGSSQIGEYSKSIIVTCLGIIALLAISILSFQRQEL